jgi:ABC-type multidrug transport system fused ATPase/permease subunit
MFCLAVVVGLCWFAIESAFIFVIQSYLASIGLLSLDKTFLPKWFPVAGSAAVFTLVAFGIVRGLIWAVRNYFAMVTGQAFIRHQRSVILQVGLKHANETPTSEIALAFNDHVISSSYALQQLSQLINNLTTLALFFVAGLYLAPVEFMMSVSLLFFVVLPTKFLDHKLRHVGEELNDQKEAVNRTLTEGLRNNFFLRVYHLLDEEIRRGQKALLSYEATFRGYSRFVSLRSAAPQMFGAGIIAFVTWFSLTYIHTPGARLLSLFYIFVRMAQGASDSFTIAGDFRIQLVGLKNLYRWNQHLMQIEKAPDPQIKLDAKELERITIQCDNLGFAYGPHDVLSGINLNIRPGEKLLIRGESGSGKSTLLSLLFGLLKPTKGAILINQHDPTQIRGSLSERIGYVGPDPYLVPGTIRRNLLYGHPHPETILDEDFWQALRSAQLSTLVEEFQSRLDEEIFERAQLSTGQKQRLAIARALLRKPVLLILDEATANLDPHTEKNFVDLLPSLTTVTTTVIVSHKDAFDSIADKIVNLDTMKLGLASSPQSVLI